MNDLHKEIEEFEKEMLRKIDAKEPLTDDELYELLDYEIDEEVGDSGRWTESVSTIIELQGRHFAIDWQRGLTELQDNEFDGNPYEVTLKEYEKTITVREWVAKEESEEITNG